MARKNKNQDLDMDMDFENEEQEGKGSKVVSGLIGFVIFLIFLGLIMLFIKLDIGGLGSQVLRPVLKDVPVINKVLPEASDADLAFENNYQYDNLTDANAKIKELEKQLESAQNSLKEANTDTSDLKKEVKRLKVFEKEQTEFKKRVEEFDDKVVFNDKAPDIEEYKKFYEGIEPENASKIYQEVVKQMQADAKTEEQANRYAKMEPANAARALEVMTGDIDLVAEILSAMKPAASAAIMNEMDPNFTAKVTKKMTTIDE
ncbi:flagellar protein FlbB [Lachnospiraceae bacterium KM106-2]|nr:flagellar protein FlbB [Lachnospiraceae bacterium KM106-2]